MIPNRPRLATLRLNLTAEVEWLIPNLILRSGLIISSSTLQLHCSHCTAVTALQNYWNFQLFLNGCADACAASILVILSASASQIRLCLIVLQSNVIKVNKKTLTRYIGVARIFDWGETKLQITRKDVIKIFRKEGLFTEQRYCRMEDQNPGPGLACNLGFAKEKGL